MESQLAMLWSISPRISKNQDVENVVDNPSDDNEISFTQEALDTEEIKQDLSNDLKEFGVDTNELDLFSSEDQDPSSDDILSSLEEESEDDLEIPAFLEDKKINVFEKINGSHHGIGYFKTLSGIAKWIN